MAKSDEHLRSRTPDFPERGQPLEDRALKMAAQFFGDELLPLLGIPGKVRRIAPTEQVHLQIKTYFEDFNFEMEDGTSHYYGVEVITTVICTSNVHVEHQVLIQGINAYQVRIVQTKEKNADDIIWTLEQAQEASPLSRNDMVTLLITPLMSGNMPQKERIKKSLAMVQKEYDRLEKAEFIQMESVLYTFAMKFLSKQDLDKVKEEFQMTILGQMIWDDGLAQGEENGIRAMIESNLDDGKTEAHILSKLERYFSLSPDAAKAYFEKFANIPTK